MFKKNDKITFNFWKFRMSNSMSQALFCLSVLHAINILCQSCLLFVCTFSICNRICMNKSQFFFIISNKMLFQTFYVIDHPFIKLCFKWLFQIFTWSTNTYYAVFYQNCAWSNVKKQCKINNYVSNVYIVSFCKNIVYLPI